jgi:soluble lytic murein transglycosylase-like protein
VWRIGLEGLAEAIAIVVTTLVLVTMALGHFAARFAGDRTWTHLLPFAATVLVIGGVGAAGLYGWIAARPWLAARHVRLPLGVAGALAVAAGVVTCQPLYRADLASLRYAVGGSAEAQRATLGHQVYAAYRRSDLHAIERMLERAKPFEPAVQEAATAFGVDGEVLMGIAAAESSFRPRDSADGGHGLFQITAPPASAVAETKQRLHVTDLDLANPTHNAYLAAATLRIYYDQMHGDPLLALLAYNIGPKNGGLATIMQHFGAHDFVTAQPYLKDLPRDYPVRVLAAALAVRLWRSEGRLLRYEDGDNARRIQALGIPGIAAEESLVSTR